jgi:hypothetical protein
LKQHLPEANRIETAKKIAVLGFLTAFSGDGSHRGRKALLKF